MNMFWTEKGYDGTVYVFWRGLLVYKRSACGLSHLFDEGMSPRTWPRKGSDAFVNHITYQGRTFHG